MKIYCPPNSKIRTVLGCSDGPLHTKIAEFVDNAFQAKAKNIDIILRKSKIVISDDGLGMDQEALQKALTIAQPPADTTGVSRFGVGLKVAMASIGSVFSIETARDGRILSVKDDLDIDNNFEYQVRSRKDSTRRHGTTIVIERLKNQIRADSIVAVMNNLGLVYMGYLKTASITINGKECKPIKETYLPAEQVPIPGLKKNPQPFRIQMSNGAWISGEVGIAAVPDKTASKTRTGIHTLYRGKVVTQFDKFDGLITSRLDHARIRGSVSLNGVPVGSNKSSWIRDSDEFYEAKSLLKPIIRPFLGASHKLAHKNSKIKMNDKLIRRNINKIIECLNNSSEFAQCRPDKTGRRQGSGHNSGNHKKATSRSGTIQHRSPNSRRASSKIKVGDVEFSIAHSTSPQGGARPWYYEFVKPNILRIVSDSSHSIFNGLYDTDSIISVHIIEAVATYWASARDETIEGFNDLLAQLYEAIAHE